MYVKGPKHDRQTYYYITVVNATEIYEFGRWGWLGRLIPTFLHADQGIKTKVKEKIDHWFCKKTSLRKNGR